MPRTTPISKVCTFLGHHEKSSRRGLSAQKIPVITFFLSLSSKKNSEQKNFQILHTMYEIYTEYKHENLEFPPILQFIEGEISNLQVSDDLR